MTDRRDQEELLALMAEVEHRQKYAKLFYAFPNDGKYSRHQYPEAMKLFAAGRHYKERGYVAGNRTGKSYAMSYEGALHLTGMYPEWWEGHRFDHPITAWVVGVSALAMLDSVQKHLLGPRNDEGSGLIPKDYIHGEPSSRQGTPGARQSFYVKHFTDGKFDGYSQCSFKSYEQDVDSFMGAAVDWVHLDEEPPRDIYTECLTRTATTEGHIVCTFTPLNGVSDVFLMFAPNLQIPEDGKVSDYRFCVNKTWTGSDIPHLTEEAQKRMIDSFAPWELDARTKGMPSIGAGAVFPVAEGDVTCPPFEIPEYWAKFNGLDVGWKKTACVFCAYDKDNDIVYVYGEYYRGYAEASIHADAIKQRGKWIPVAIDPASNTPSQKDGDKLFVEYAAYGLELTKADNAVTAGIIDMLQRFSTGRLKIFSTCSNLLNEYRMYQYDEEGRIRKQNDHALDALRYAIRTGFHRRKVRPDDDDWSYQVSARPSRDPTTGY